MRRGKWKDLHWSDMDNLEWFKNYEQFATKLFPPAPGKSRYFTCWIWVELVDNFVTSQREKMVNVRGLGDTEAQAIGAARKAMIIRITQTHEANMTRLRMASAAMNGSCHV